MDIKITVSNEKKYTVEPDNNRFSVIGLGKPSLRAVGVYLEAVLRTGFRYSLPIKFTQILGGAALPASLPADLN